MQLSGLLPLLYRQSLEHISWFWQERGKLKFRTILLLPYGYVRRTDIAKILLYYIRFSLVVKIQILAGTQNDDSDRAFEPGMD